MARERERERERERMESWLLTRQVDDHNIYFGGARGVMVIVAGYGHGDASSNPGPDWLHFT